MIIIIQKLTFVFWKIESFFMFIHKEMKANLLGMLFFEINKQKNIWNVIRMNKSKYSKHNHLFCDFEKKK